MTEGYFPWKVCGAVIPSVSFANDGGIIDGDEI
jgi:hypothetical protein